MERKNHSRTNQSRTNKGRRESDKQRNLIMQWLFPVVFFFLVVLAMLYNYAQDVQDTNQARITKDFSTAANWYARDLKSELTAVAQATKPFAELLAQEGPVNTRQNLAYISALKENSLVREVWLVNESGKGMDAEGYVVEIRDETLSLAITGNQPQYKMTTIWSNDTPVIAYICPLKSQDGCIISYYDPTQFVADTSVFNFDSRTWYGMMDAQGVLYTVTGGSDAGVSVGDNILEELSYANLEGNTYAKILKKIDTNGKIQFKAQVNGGEYFFVFVPMKICDWYYVISLPNSYAKLLYKAAWSSTRDVLIYLGGALLLFISTIAVMNSINKRKYSDQSRDWAKKADTDLLTELNNKMATERKITEYMIEHPDAQAMLFIFDIDNFKKINDTMGHAFGDEVLRSIGAKLRSEFRVSDVIGRAGGDEFIILLKDIKTDEMIKKEAERVASLFKHFKAGEYTKYSVTASVGCAIYPRDGKDFETLYKAADKGLYRAKKAGKNQLSFYKDEEK